MKYFKNIENGYIVSVSTMYGQIEIIKDEYNEILAVIKTTPIAEDGFSYKLKEDLTWELTEIVEEELINE